MIISKLMGNKWRKMANMFSKIIVNDWKSIDLWQVNNKKRELY
jgi:hypothetical protein